MNYTNLPKNILLTAEVTENAEIFIQQLNPIIIISDFVPDKNAYTYFFL